MKRNLSTAYFQEASIRLYKLLQFIKTNNLLNIVSNTWVALRISQTISITIPTTAERSFSKLKCIRTYLRPTMGSKRLKSIAQKCCCPGIGN